MLRPYKKERVYTYVGMADKFYNPINLKILPVISEMILSSKRFSANVTGVRSFIRVGSFVDQQGVALGELPIAKFADELFFWSR